MSNLDLASCALAPAKLEADIYLTGNRLAKWLARRVSLVGENLYG